MAIPIQVLHAAGTIQAQAVREPQFCGAVSSFGHVSVGWLTVYDPSLGSGWLSLSPFIPTDVISGNLATKRASVSSVKCFIFEAVAQDKVTLKGPTPILSE